MLKNIIKISWILIAFVLLISFFNPVEARNIIFQAKKLEALDGVPYNTQYPALVYRTYTGAAQRTRNWYNGISVDGVKLDKSEDGWVYVQGKNSTTNNKNVLTITTDKDGNITKYPNPSPTSTTFKTSATYFHPSENTAYSTESGSMKYSVYTSYAETSGVESITIPSQSVRSTTSVIGETNNYKGIYDQPAIWGGKGSLIIEADARYENGIYEIIEDQNFLWRMRVSGTTYISDIIIQPNHYEKIYKLFSEQINSGEYIYLSSVAYSNGRNVDNLDTAYKFYDALSWWGVTTSTTFTGSSDGKDSFINLYDNKIRLPRTVGTTVYVRYIDVTGVDNYTPEIINQKAAESTIKKVGFAKINGTEMVASQYNASYSDNEEKFVFTAEQLEENDTIRMYNKFYDDITKTRIDGKDTIDNTDYSDYSYVGFYSGTGLTIERAIQNRDEKYEFSRESVNEPVVDVVSGAKGEYVVIDFLYKKADPVEVYVRHIDVTGVDNYTTEVIDQKAQESKIKRVGFAKINGTDLIESVNNEKYTTNQEQFLIESGVISKEDYISIYNKLYDDNTKTTKVNNKKDTTDYSNYSYVGFYSGQGNTLQEAISNRTSKYDSSDIIPDTGARADIMGEATAKYIVIDFLYRTDVNPQVYIRHVDITGLDLKKGSIDSETISKLVSDQKGEIIKKVGYVGEKNGKKLNYKQTLELSSKEYEYFQIKKNDSKSYEIYNKLYDSNTQKSYYPDGTTKDTTNYTGYEYSGYVIAYGDTMEEAIKNREENINNAKFKTGSSNKKITLTKSDITKPYVLIDFYYKNNTKVQDAVVLVRHINVSGINKTDAKSITEIVDNGNLGTNIFDGYAKGMLNATNTYLTAKSTGKVKYKSSLDVYNEIYEIKKSNINTKYKLYNEFFGTNSDVEYEYIGYIMGKDKYALDLAEISRNAKIDKVDFSNLNTLDGKSGSGYIEVKAGDDKYIVIDMYYREKEAVEVKEAPAVTGRLTFDSVKSDFKRKTNNTYDVIPSGEEMYASITKASKYMLAGIRILPMNITNSQTVTITVNVPYKYSYKYWSSTECSEGHTASASNVGQSCTTTITCDCDECTCEPCTCDHQCGKTLKKVYSTGDNSGTVTQTITYTLPYNYTYYKVSNMRVYKIDHMELYDTENTTDLPLFDGNKHTIGVSEAYKTSVKGNFTSSASSQELLDNRGSIVDISTPKIENEGKADLVETVTLSEVEFSEKTFSDKIYTDSTASTKCYNDYVSTPMTNIENAITKTTAPTIKSASTDGTISTVDNADAGARVKFTISNDKIKIGSQDILAKTDSAREVTTTINLSSGTYESVTTENNTIYKGTENKLETTYPDNVYKQYGYSKEVVKTTQSDFIQNTSTKLSIPMTRLNGERISNAKIYYKILEDKAINFDVTNSDIESKKHDWTLNSATVTGTFKDTEMNTVDGKKVETRLSISSNVPTQLEYSYTSSKTSTDDGTGDVVNVFTPIKFKVSLSNGQSSTKQSIVDHTVGSSLITSSSQIIQKDTRFTISIKPENSHEYYGALSDGISKYIDSYYIKFKDLDVQEVQINGEEYNDGFSIVANTWIGPIKNIGNNTKISAIASENPNYSVSVLEQDTNTYVVRGVTKNATQLMLSDLEEGKYDSNLVDSDNSGKKAENSYKFGGFASLNKLRHVEYYLKSKLYNDNNYVAETDVITTRNLSRVYDFKITDVKDLDWKDTFRKSTNTNTNVHSGVVYYSGVNKWNIYSTDFKDIRRRTTDEIGATSQRTLPVGPYKNTNASYVYAPKLGYRFSFDFKTTGKIDLGKEANINVSFMFIDKTAGVSDSSRLKEVDLYYKNSSNKYVKIDENNKMSLYFVPNDGYRLTFTESTYNFNQNGLSNTTVKLGDLTNLKLDSKMMAISDNEFVQIWYGEYKLPNSTIAVDKGETDLNKKKTNGYIAVKFDIQVTDKYTGRDSVTIAYNQNDKAATSTTNTSQWDYEGYLGFNNPGQEANNLSLRLDSGVVWTINNEIYNKLKGTVMLYDVDARAASDYN